MWHRVATENFSVPFPSHHKPNARLQQQSFTEKRPVSYGTLDSTTETVDQNIFHRNEMQHDSVNSDRTPLHVEMEIDASVQRQRLLLKSIRTCATGLCIIAGTVMLVAYFTNNNTKPSVIETPALTLQHPNKRSRVKQPARLVEFPHRETVIRKLREEFHEWALHHGRDYGTDEERERRFHVWKDNHVRYVSYFYIITVMLGCLAF
jgi:hypothetical protein